jgi:hypothetical protein
MDGPTGACASWERLLQACIRAGELVARIISFSSFCHGPLSGFDERDGPVAVEQFAGGGEFELV